MRQSVIFAAEGERGCVFLQSAAVKFFMADGNRKILCIDDDRETAALIAEDMNHRGFDVIVADDGPAGLLEIMRATPDFILCDLILPTMTGFEVLARLNELAPRLGRIPIAFLAASADRDSELRGRLLGADDYITKPIDFERLAYIINARIEGVARNKMMPKFVRLSEDENRLLTLAARGKTSAEIAQMLNLSKRTVDFHIDNARRKLSAATRTEAVLKAVTTGLIDL
jgi:DNA-binding NarL/FixJ family response regulator